MKKMIDPESARQAIIKYMKTKHQLINADLTVDYFNHNDEADIKHIPDDKIIEAYQFLRKTVLAEILFEEPPISEDKLGLPLDSKLCPYCIIYFNPIYIRSHIFSSERFDQIRTSCPTCPYAKRHGNCIDDDFSDYQKIIHSGKTILYYIKAPQAANIFAEIFNEKN